MRTPYAPMSAKIAVAAGLLILLVYPGLNTGFHFKFVEHEGLVNFNMLAEAFLSGRLHLCHPVDQERLASGDPLNPSLPYPFLPDAIIWEGKYYVHQQPLPALMHAAYSALTGRPFPTGIGVVMAAFGNAVLLGAILIMLRRRYFADAPSWIVLYVWLSFAFSSGQLYMVSRPVIYHEAIATACFLVLSGSIVLVHAMTRSRGNTALWATSGALFAAAIGCRIISVLYVFGFALCAILPAFLTRRPAFEDTRRLFAFVFPPMCGFAALLAYNCARFGNVADFGESHIVFPTHDQYLYTTLGNNYLRLEHIPYNVYYYFLKLPYLGRLLDLPGFPVGEHIHSLCVALPIPLLCLAIPILRRYGAPARGLPPIICGCCVSSILMMAFFLAYQWASLRFAYEFTLLLYVAAYCSLAMLWGIVADNPRLKRVTQVALSIALTLQFAAGIAYAWMRMRA